MHTYDSRELAAANPLGGYRRYTASDIAFANASNNIPAAITGFSFPILKGQVWLVEARLITLGVSGGGKVSVSGPASPNLLIGQVEGIISGITAFSTDVLSALDTLSAAYNTSAVTGLIRASFLFGASADGTVSLNAANVTGGNSFVLKAGSSLIATRLQ